MELGACCREGQGKLEMLFKVTWIVPAAREGVTRYMVARNRAPYERRHGIGYKKAEGKVGTGGGSML